MQKRILPASSVSGSIILPGDKSISHRYAMIAAVAEGATRIRNYSTGADCHSTLGCLRALGVEVEGQASEFVIHGKGLDGLRASTGDLDAGNSGSTIRMLSGILAGQPFRSRIFGDESLSRRPMQRITKPLAEMGARIRARQDKYPPLEIEGGDLHPIDYKLPVPSAQVKTCVLFAGLFADGETSVTEPVRSRDHTENQPDRPASSQGAGTDGPVRSLLGRLLYRGRSIGTRLKAHHPRCRPQPYALGIARFSERDRRENPHSPARKPERRAGGRYRSRARALTGRHHRGRPDGGFDR
jgi:hypothetical protein